MASKKYMLILGFISLFSSGLIAQTGDAGYDWRDSTKIPTRLMPQQSEFLNNQYPYPAKPRDMWELGLSGGLSAIIGDVSPRPGFGVGISARKSLNHTFSLRGGYIGSINYGLDYRLRRVNTIPGNMIGDPWRGNYAQTDQFVANYRNKAHQVHVELVASLLNANHYRGNPKNDLYVYGGYSFLSMDIDVNALNASGQKYNFAPIFAAGSQKRSDIRSRLKDLLNDGNKDTEYESNAGVLNGSRANVNVTDKYGKQVQRHAISGGAGFSHKFSNRINIGIDQRFTYAFDDNLDATQATVGSGSNDLLSYTSLRMNINMGSSAKKVQPLWWLNPNNYVYNELNAPQHMKFPTPVLPDADGDGVTDQFDMEPNTPAGAPVDVRGVSKDTDGDGVPDYKDKELLTSQKCFPVNADGVGTCPEPACCTELRDMLKNYKPTECGIGSLPSIQFRRGSTLTQEAQNLLASAASQIKANPNCKVKVTGYGAQSKSAQQLSWDRVNAVIKYMVEKQGISEDRFIFAYGTEGGDPATVDLMGTVEEGPNSISAPHPNMKQ